MRQDTVVVAVEMKHQKDGPRVTGARVHHGEHVVHLSPSNKRGAQGTGKGASRSGGARKWKVALEKPDRLFEAVDHGTQIVVTDEEGHVVWKGKRRGLEFETDYSELMGADLSRFLGCLRDGEDVLTKRAPGGYARAAATKTATQAKCFVKEMGTGGDLLRVHGPFASKKAATTCAEKRQSAIHSAPQTVGIVGLEVICARGEEAEFLEQFAKAQKTAAKKTAAKKTAAKKTAAKKTATKKTAAKRTTAAKKTTAKKTTAKKTTAKKTTAKKTTAKKTTAAKKTAAKKTAAKKTAPASAEAKPKSAGPKSGPRSSQRARDAVPPTSRSDAAPPAGKAVRRPSDKAVLAAAKKGTSAEDFASFKKVWDGPGKAGTYGRMVDQHVPGPWTPAKVIQWFWDWSHHNRAEVEAILRAA